MPKYNIISVDDSRQAYKDKIRAAVPFEEVRIPTVDARYDLDIPLELNKRGLWIVPGKSFTRGEIGVWLSVFDCWVWCAEHNEELITFEDDAIIKEFFTQKFVEFYRELPRDFDFMTLWIPHDQMVDYQYDLVYDEVGYPTIVGPNRNIALSLFNFGSYCLARAYNGYGNVAVLYSPKGAQRFIERARATGIFEPVDCYLYLQAHAGYCNGYGPKPFYSQLVDYDWRTQTTIHTTERYT